MMTLFKYVHHWLHWLTVMMMTQGLVKSENPATKPEQTPLKRPVLQCHHEHLRYSTA